MPARKSFIYMTSVLAVALLISAYFVATQPITPKMAIISSISVILFALPSYWAVTRLQGMKRGLFILAILGIYAIIIESSALATGFPYGDFTYTNVLGNKIFGLTPWTVAFAYPPILLLAYNVARFLLPHLDKPKIGKYGLLLQAAGLTALFATACDVVLDPAAVRLGFWYWDDPGWFYGVPLVNFAGWLLSGFIGGLIIHLSWRKSDVRPSLGYSGLVILWFWTAVNLWLGQWVPAIFGLLLSVFFLGVIRTKLMDSSRQGTMKS